MTRSLRRVSHRFAVLSVIFAGVLAGAPRAFPSPAARQGTPETGMIGISETVDRIMARETGAGKSLPGTPPVESERAEQSRGRPFLPRANPRAPAVSQWPLGESGEHTLGPQIIGTSFKAAGIAEAGFSPPDSMGAVGETQILIHVNGRIKVFDKSGVLGSLDASDASFWSAVADGHGITDPQVRYDRISGRFVVLAVNLPAANPNRVMIAVQTVPGPITATSSFTFYYFTVNQGGDGPSDDSSFCDYPSLGVDRDALYVGCIMLGSSGTFLQTTGFVVRKSSLIPAPGSIVVTAFRTLAAGSGHGPYAPRGVDNDDPQSTEGYFIGADLSSFSLLQIRRVFSPGGAPAISGNLSLTVPTTTTPIPQAAQGSSTGLDPLDDRLFAAAIHKNKITGASTLWTAHNIQVNSSCIASGTGGRNGARWYEITGLTGTPTLVQSGTLCDNAASHPRGYIVPTVTGTGQGHMALATTFAATDRFAGVIAAGRLRTDAPGLTRAPTFAVAGLAPYTLIDPQGLNRWGDYSLTSVDPTDDQTVWTIQEYADSPANSWAVRAVQLRSLPPATPVSANPSTVCAGLPSVAVTVTGSSVAGSEFFDPGPDAGGPGYTRHLAASLAGGTPPAVTGANLVDPTHIALSLDTTAATPGAKGVTVTNPDGQAVSGGNLITVAPAPAPPTATSNGPICAGATLELHASTVAAATYAWAGPNGFSSAQQDPSIPGASAAATGTYTVTVTVTGCTSAGATTTATVIGAGQGCDDGAPCTTGDACQAGGACSGTAIVCTASDGCHVAGTCDAGTGACSDPLAADGTTCNDGDPATCSDACSNGTCAGTPVAAPPEIDDSLHLSKGAGSVSILWSDVPGPYDLYRGANGGGAAWQYDQVCLGQGLTQGIAADAQDPPAFTFYYYLVSRVEECRESVLGRNSGGTPDPNDLPCF